MSGSEPAPGVGAQALESQNEPEPEPEGPYGGDGHVSSESLKKRIVKLEQTHKFQRGLAIGSAVIASIALLAPIASAIAAKSSLDTARQSAQTARESLQTAKDSVQLARDVAEKSGAVLSTDGMIHVAGSCGDNANPLVAVAHVVNQGHLAGRVNGSSLTVAKNFEDLPDEVKAAMQRQGLGARGSFWINIASANTNAVVNPQDSVDITMPVDCTVLHFMGIDTNDPVQGIVRSIDDRKNTWQIRPIYAYNTPPEPLRVNGVSW